ncbi:GNAT family N-acetyltransferase [Billgrantia endophytica]|uniref:N-acetyltransferase n=1 Tax=Billgrantia endophytica TaxID=2033802 RepID=A0A2N7U803_9GAMM|nr:GNAT family protein [Halomonas endophytica]PMR76556.1 N-acetyltransferase [Halomonas endophytica]
MTTHNAFGQPVGDGVEGWQGARPPGHEAIPGRLVRLEPLSPDRHGEDLYSAFLLPGDGPGDSPAARWTYSGGMPFEDAGSHRTWLSACAASRDPLYFAIVEQTSSRATGLATYLNIVPEQGCIEVGNLHFTPWLRRTPAATEAMMLMMKHAFALGYRRYEWKCDALNAPSRRAAERLGFRFEGIFRQHRVVQGRNRDTAWFSVLDDEWPRLEGVLERWLSPDNFDAHGQQRLSLSSLMARGAR